VFAQLLPVRLERFGRRLVAECAHRDGQAAVPVRVEARGKPSHRGADDEHVEVAEVEILAHGKVFVAHVPASGDADGVVDQEQLVVHAVGQAIPVECEFRRPNRREPTAV
jgi:hypothetical protein